MRIVRPLLLVFFLLTACSGDEQISSRMNYDETKRMVIDILKTDDGKKAIKEVLKDKDLNKNLIMEQPEITKTIEQTLTSEKGKKFWEKSFQDPNFSNSFANGVKTENEKLLKSLMKDPEYQTMMLDILKDPSYEQEVMKLLKSKDFRQHLQKIMLETFESPLYKKKVADLLVKEANDQLSGKNDQQNQTTSGGQKFSP
ncbi:MULTISPECIES: spore germination lipoprotein GerD [Bacillus]|uniref:spore germination lipoprotein GerD n=2 Tax=Bacillaceae TaxID=186817 RepID=UPI00065DCC92|nr:spore germination lipoprotein GerD [Bacillus smithii]AKP45565.1 Spore germination protein GerD [Bacillus smithii]MED0660359.1 spore germination lipoprotein GerD [Bacillus smithii]MED1489317.1 spore germination lipoprotein GerD [Bacillus smithii]MED4884033.1 spore germination lipoprotein GerD [Bacillus smithii]